MKTESFRISYDGSALQTHEMDVRQLAPALLAMGDLFEHANRVLYAGKSKVQVNVKGSFKTGSFGIDLQAIQSITDQLIDLLVSKEASALGFLVGLIGFAGYTGKDAAKSLIGAIRWCKGRAITKVTQSDGKAQLFCDKDMLEIELQVFLLLKDYEVRKALSQVIEQPLKQDGIDTFASGTDTELTLVIKREESKWFATPQEVDEDLGEIRYQKTVQIARIEWNEDNKWRFTDGNQTFYATITDDDFLRKIAFNEAAFSRGDVLKVAILERQKISGGAMRSEYLIEHVLEHRQGARQIPLPLSTPHQQSS